MYWYKDGEQKTWSILVDPLVCVLKSGTFGNLLVHGSIIPVEDNKRNRPDVALVVVSLKSPPTMTECPSDWHALMNLIKSSINAFRGWMSVLPSLSKRSRCWCHAVMPTSFVGCLLTWYAEMIVTGVQFRLRRLMYVHLPSESPPFPFGVIRPTVDPVRIMAVPPGRYSVVVMVGLELNWLHVFVLVLRLIDCWRSWSVFLNDVLRQCSVMH